MIKQQLDSDLKTAMLERDRSRVDALKNLKAAILNEEVATGKRAEGLSDSELQVLIARELKKRLESAKLYTDNARADLAGPEEAEAEILRAYLPKQLSEDELTAVISEVIAGMGEVTAKDMGRVIGNVKARVGQSADGAEVARLVKQKLS